MCRAFYFSQFATWSFCVVACVNGPKKKRVTFVTCTASRVASPSKMDADAPTFDPIGAAIKSRDLQKLRDLASDTFRDVPGLKIGLPKMSQTHMEDAKALAAVAKELVDACRAKAGAPRVKGAFCVCICTPAAPRAASLFAAVCRSSKAAKFFGRHRKTVEEQTAFLVANEVDVIVGTPSRLARLDPLQLDALRYILVDCTPDEKGMTVFTAPSKKMAGRRPDTEGMAAMLNSPAFEAAAQRGKRAPTLCPVLLPAMDDAEAPATDGERPGGRGRGRSGGKGGKGGGRGGGKGKGKGKGRGPIFKKHRGK